MKPRSPVRLFALATLAACSGSEQPAETVPAAPAVEVRGPAAIAEVTVDLPLGGPEGLAYSSWHDRYYLVVGRPAIYVVDQQGKIDDTIQVDQPVGLKGIETLENGTFAGVDSRTSDLVIVDLDGKVVSRTATGLSAARGVSVNQQTDVIYVVCRETREIRGFDHNGATGERISVPAANPQGLVALADGRFLVLDEDRREVVLVSDEGQRLSGLPLSHLADSLDPEGLAYDAETHRAYVAFDKGSKIVVLDCELR